MERLRHIVWKYLFVWVINSQSVEQLSYSIGLWGNYDVYTNGKKVAKYNEAFDKYGIRRCDFGLGMGLGLQYSEHYQLNISYNHGLAQLTHPEKKEKMFSTPSLYNRTFNITISYIF